MESETGLQPCRGPLGLPAPPQGQVLMSIVHHGDLVVKSDQQLAEPLAQLSLVSIHQYIGLIITLVLQIQILKQREI